MLIYLLHVMEPGAKISVGDFVFDYLSKCGIKRIFYLPGGGVMHLNDSLVRSGLEATLCLHEQAVAIAAEYYGRVSQEPFGVALVTNGPGATNTLTAVAGAYIESIPLLVIAGQVKRADYKPGKNLRQSGVQEVATLQMVKGITKYSTIILEPEMIVEELEKCRKNLMTGRLGPVWLEIPLDVQAAETRPFVSDHLEYSTQNNEPSRVFPPVDQIAHSITQISSNIKRPLLLVGQGVRQAEAVQDLTEYINKVGMPVITTFPAKDFIHYDHKLFAGHPGNVALRNGNLAVQNCDLLISIGSSLNNVVTAYNPEMFGRNARKIIIDIDDAELEKHVMPDCLKIKADPHLAIEALKLSGIFNGNVDPAWTAFLASLKDKYKYPNDPAFQDDLHATTGRKLSIYNVVNALGSTLSTYKYIVTGSSGLCIEAFYMLFRNEPGQRILIDSGLGSMGYGLPALIGACEAKPKEKVILFEGDGSFQMNIQELALISAKQMNCLIILINNEGYASIKNSQKGYFNGRLLGCDQKSGLRLPDTRKMAEAYGIEYFEIKKIEELNAAEEKMRDKCEPAILEVFTEGDVILQPRVRSVKQDDGSMISLPIEDMTPLLTINELKIALKYSAYIQYISYEVRQ